MVFFKSSVVVAVTFLFVPFFSLPVNAQEENQPIEVSEEGADVRSLAAASGHYARTRHFIIKAVQEFDLGVKFVDPQLLLDIQQWRNTLLDRAEDLERILDPQPQANQQGVDFVAAPRFINEEYLKPKELTKIGAPITEVKGKTLKVGIKHYAQARNLLLTAVREFDLGVRLANPQILVDISAWRNSILDRAEDLNRILAPKPRESETGTTYTPDSRLLNGAIR